MVISKLLEIRSKDRELNRETALRLFENTTDEVDGDDNGDDDCIAVLMARESESGRCRLEVVGYR